MTPDVVYLLDLCTLAYQLHGQSLLFPIDPYFEQAHRRKTKGEKRGVSRSAFFEAHADHFRTLSPGPPAPGGAILRGPGFLGGDPVSGGWTENPQLDPIVHDYGRISPYRPGLVRPSRVSDGLIIYRAPPAITDRIGGVKLIVFNRSKGPHASAPQLDVILMNQLQPPDPKKAPDQLYCFEGGTGSAKSGDGANWSLMGFVLAREDETSTAASRPYDVHIAFRGSRSGGLRPARGLGSRGSPDWVTDLAMKFDVVTAIGPGQMHRGFARAMALMMPAIAHALQLVHQDRSQQPPRSIAVTGHSLGGALATCFASAILLGDKTGPGLNGSLPNELKAWPWGTMNLRTFSAPPVGGQAFAHRFGAKLQCSNLSLANDFIPAGRGTHPGANVRYSSRTGPFDSHEPRFIREKLVRVLGTDNVSNADHTPWVVCDTLYDALKTLQAVSTTLKTDLQAMLPRGNADDLNLYLDYLGKALGTDIAKNEILEARRLLKAVVDTKGQNLLADVLSALKSVKVDSSLQRCLRYWLTMVALEAGRDWGRVDADRGWIQ